MRVSRLVLSLAFAAAGATLAVAGPLEDFRSEVLVRRDQTRVRTPRRAALTRAAKVLAKDGLLVDEVNAAYQAVRHVEARFRRDAEFDAAEQTLAEGLAALVADDRDVLDARRGTLGDEAAEQRLDDGLADADAALARASGEADPFRALKSLRDAANALRAAMPPRPDFSVRDVNENSPTYDARVSPRDFAERFSAWYFGAAT